MARRKRNEFDSQANPEITNEEDLNLHNGSELVEEFFESDTSKVHEPLEVGPDPSSPEEFTLTSNPEGQGLKDKQSKESIEAAIHEKLSNRGQEGQVDPFVPSAQLQNEVKQVAKANGFQLSRGTEAGAALMARARRRAQS
jgi:hypothetical protein